MSFDLDTALRGARAPIGLRELVRSPQDHLDAVLSGTARMGHLAAADPVLVLSGWLQHFGGSSGFGVFLDDALSTWIANRWGSFDPPRGVRSTRILATAWCSAARLVAISELLRDSAKELGRRVSSDPAFLAAMAEGISLDPLDEARRGLARRQLDSSLVSYWWSLCRLPVDEPWYRGAAGVLGLLQLPGAGFPGKGANALVSYGKSLVLRVDEGWLDEARARRFYMSLVRLAARLAPVPNQWSLFWTRRAETIEGRLRNWLDDAVDGNLAAIAARHPAARPQHFWDASWLPRVEDLERRLLNDELDAITAAHRLLSEQQQYGEAIGDWDGFVKSGGRLASAGRQLDPGQALRWSEEVRSVDPLNVHSWTISITLLRDLGRIRDSLDLAVEAMRRFPENVFVWTSLGQSMLESGNFVRSEQVFRDAISRFPDNAHSWSGLVTTLQAAQRWDEAESVLADAQARGVWNDVFDNLLQGVRARKPYPVPAQGVPEVEVQGAATEDGTDIRVLLTDNYVIRRWARKKDALDSGTMPLELREQARSLLDRLAEVEATDSRAAAAALLLRADFGFIEDLQVLLAEARVRYPGSVRVAYAASRAERLTRKQSPGNAPEPTQVVRHLRRLERLDGRLRPVVLLGTARIYLEGGNMDQARDPLGELAWWSNEVLTKVSGTSGPTADTNFAKNVRKTLFAEAHPHNAETLPDLEVIAERVADPTTIEFLDHSEEDAAFRVAAA